MPAALAAEERSGRSTRRKPLSLGLDSEPDQSTSCDEEEALRALSRTFATTFPSLKSSDSLHDRHSKPALVGNAEAHGASSEESNEPLASAEDSSSDTSLDTPSLSTGSLSSNEDGFILQEHLAQLYSVATPDLTPNSSSTTLTTLNTNTPTPSQPQLVHEHNFYSEGLQLDHIGRDQEDSPPQTPIPEEDDSRMLSLPLKVCAYALALLPIPSSVFSSRRAPSPPPLPVEHPESPKIYRPKHRSTPSPTFGSLQSSPLGSCHNLPALNTATSLKNRNRKVCFDRVVVIRSPSDSDDDHLPGENPSP